MTMQSVIALRGRQEPWMRTVLDDHARLEELIEAHGSPVNLIHPARLRDHAAELVEAAAAEGVELRVYFARKANKALALVDEAMAAGHGVDVASQRELTQVVARLDGHRAVDRVVVTAAVKPRRLMESAIACGAVISIDNTDELRLLHDIAADRMHRVPVALRLRPRIPGAPVSRFGLPSDELRTLLAPDQRWWRRLRFVGVHFHLHGYAAGDRAVALDEALDLVEFGRALGHRPEFVDIGGGVPMSYLAEPQGWNELCRRNEDRDLRGLTWQSRPIGTVYPAWQTTVRGEWLTEVLRQHVGGGGRSVAARLRAVGVRLHIEPGRALLDGCGVTVARVEFRKRQPDGSWLVGLAMNRTQCRSAADDFLVDPVLIPAPDAERTPAGDGFLVGAYCIEAELLSWRRMRFPDGVAVGDLVAFINTAGYQMHILESASHQIPLARNLVPDPGAPEGIESAGGWVIDAIDR